MTWKEEIAGAFWRCQELPHLQIVRRAGINIAKQAFFEIIYDNIRESVRFTLDDAKELAQINHGKEADNVPF